jgi:hypothetical protein
MLFEAHNSLQLANALEMAVFTGVTLALPFRLGITHAFSLLVRKPFLSFCAIFVLAFGTFTGLGTTNLGSLSRYRAPLVPFFATLLIAFIAQPRASRREVPAFSPLANDGAPPADGRVLG